MADVQEVINENENVDSGEKKAAEKKIVEVDVDKDDESEEKPKENGKAENGDAKETNGDAVEVTTTKRKSEAGDAPDGTPAEGATPEKKAKISAEEKETEESTNGESEVAA